MKKLVFALLLGLVAVAISAQGTYAQAASGLSGKAVRWNGEPIVGATISILAGPLESDKELARTATGADGSWSVELPAGGPYWVHIRTFGSWWGYSYQTPFALRAGEQISQIWLALGPRDVREITLPEPISNVQPGTGEAPPTPVSNVKPGIGVGEEPGMPRTGEGDRQLDGTLLLALGLAVLLIGSGLRARVMAGGE